YAYSPSAWPYILQLNRFVLTRFKNYETQTVDCAPRLNCFVGRNGSGKTNLLEAIYYLCMGKSHTGISDQFAIQHGEDFFRLDGAFERADADKDLIAVKVQKRKRKVIERNKLAYERLSEHVGRYPVVIVVPDDVRLVHDGSELRRRLLNNSLSQTDPTYLHHLLQYNKILSQRNALLKEYAGRSLPEDLLEIYDQQLAPAARYIHATRAAFIDPFSQSLRVSYAAISGQREVVDMNYKSQLIDQTWEELMQERREKDRVLQRTTAGIHRDDLVFTQEGHPLKRVASQGQLKSFVLSLKLAQYALLKEQTQRKPLLLLDDIFDKLDNERVAQLLALILREDFGQVFITDTDPERVARLIDARSTGEWFRYRVEEGAAERI
ncbi:MAG: DNA replication and repair protein RecF, partial [Bacteroidota bacterium]